MEAVPAVLIIPSLTLCFLFTPLVEEGKVTGENVGIEGGGGRFHAQLLAGLTRHRNKMVANHSVSH
jgi:hypothetical protein